MRIGKKRRRMIPPIHCPNSLLFGVNVFVIVSSLSLWCIFLPSDDGYDSSTALLSRSWVPNLDRTSPPNRERAVRSFTECVENNHKFRLEKENVMLKDTLEKLEQCNISISKDIDDLNMRIKNYEESTEDDLAAPTDEQ